MRPSLPDENRLPNTKAGRYVTITIVSVLLGVVSALIMMFLVIHTWWYGFLIFIILPMLLTRYQTLIFCSKWNLEPRQVKWTLYLTCLSAIVTVLLVAFEGIICLVVALPLWIVSSTFGYLEAVHAINQTPKKSSLFPALIFIPLGLAGDYTLQNHEAVREIKTTVTIDAPAEKIWPYLLDLDSIDTKDYWMFKAGVGHPVSIRSESGKVGGRRWCNISTGPMPEVITDYRPNQFLKFKVLSTPPTLQELNPFGEVHAKHQTGYFRCKEGQFRLVRLSNNQTRLEGTSWYSINYQPQIYWSLWSDRIVHDVHQSVMNEIKKRCETPGGN